MHRKLFATFSLFFIIILIHIPTSLCADNEQYVTCGESFQCANIPNLGYPFWGQNRSDYCGHPSFQLNCLGDVPVITIQSRSYRVLAIDNPTRTLTVNREEFWNNTCPRFLHNATLESPYFSYASNSQSLTLFYGCPATGVSNLVPNLFDCNVNDTASVSYFYTRVPTTAWPICNTEVLVQVNQTSADAIEVSNSASTGLALLQSAFASGFGLQWEANDTDCNRCAQSGGRCGTVSGSTSFTCLCADQPYISVCNGTTITTPTGNGGNSNSTSRNVVLFVVGAILAGIGIGWFIFFCRQRRKRIAAQAAAQTVSKDLPTPPSSKGLTTSSTHFNQSIPSYPSSKSDFEKGSTYFGVQVFSYDELEEATDHFDRSRELGDGGFGTVYYGVLHDGRVVAVKRLYENNFKRVEQFMNEVEILTRLRHQSLVMLFGCTSKRSRELLLVYEYIPNGTVADHLHGKRANSGLLSWPVRLNIAIETADALAYLHTSDIIHRDVKTNNILLDNDFRVKVADFGLSRLFPNDATHVSTAPQGTPGYVDPEYYQCYQLTDKSDVYSFGVVLIELISSLQAVDTNRHRHDINLANMAINKIQNHNLHELVDPSLGFETNATVRRMTTLVAELAFRCLQQEKDMRPAMEEVLQGLRRIQNEGLNAEKAEVVDIVVDDVGLLKDFVPPLSPDSVVTDKSVSSSTLTSSG